MRKNIQKGKETGNLVKNCLDDLLQRSLSPMDHLPHNDLREKLIELVLYGEPKHCEHEIAELFSVLRQSLLHERVDNARVVVFGGGSGLSNIIGGDCRKKSWLSSPFSGLKELFPQTRSVVCVTDDGGSTGELLKDLPLIALGDIRHVILSSVQLSNLQVSYALTVQEAHDVVSILSNLFNHRFNHRPETLSTLLEDCQVDLNSLPPKLSSVLQEYLEMLFHDERLQKTITRPNCLGNLIIAAAIYKGLEPDLSNDELICHPDKIQRAIYNALMEVSKIIGANEAAVLPCTSTVSKLSIRYTNGVQVTGEYKSGFARRGYPVDKVYVNFCGTPHVYPQVLEEISRADVLIMAPGSLYSSVIPIFQVPGLADAVRNNHHALKILVSNLWVQSGETDRVILDPDRKFYVSDMLRAYEMNIPGGNCGLFNEVLCVSLKDVPASVLQRYDIEGKMPIYLDRERVKEMGFRPIECGIFSQSALAEQGVIQHDPAIIARAVKTIYIASRSLNGNWGEDNSPVGSGVCSNYTIHSKQLSLLPSQRYAKIKDIVGTLSINFQEEVNGERVRKQIKRLLVDLIWEHQDISLQHLQYLDGILFIDKKRWRRDQKWDNIFSFYDPVDKLIKIRKDLLDDHAKLEIAFLVALGESLLGNYALEKKVEQVEEDGVILGKVYHLRIALADERQCFFNDDELCRYLVLARMVKNPKNSQHYTRLVNGDEGFTPPGLLMGLLYAWYLENRFATNIEYKMSVLQIKHSDLIPEQIKMHNRRQDVITFLRDVVFVN